MRIGEWSDDRSCVPLQEVRRATSVEAKEMSGVWLVLVLNGFLVSESVLLRMLRPFLIFNFYEKIKL